jgi:SP family general alpha glucoside:H+ symporter-like MFS transporter
MSFLSQVTNGGALCYSATFFFEQAGIAPSTSYGIALGGTGIAFVGTIISWGILTKFGRRPIWIYGLGGLVGILYLVGILACIPKQTDGLSYAQAGLSVAWLGWYSMTLGPVVYCIVAEIGSTRLRTQTVVLGRSTYYVANLIGGVLQPRFMSPTAWNAKGKTVSLPYLLAILSAITEIHTGLLLGHDCFAHPCLGHL